MDKRYSNSNSQGDIKGENMNKLVSIFEHIKEENQRIKEKEDLQSQEFVFLQKSDQAIQSDHERLTNKLNSLKIREYAIKTEQANQQDVIKEIENLKTSISRIESEEIFIKSKLNSDNININEHEYQTQITELTDTIEKLNTQKENLKSKIKSKKLDDILEGAEELKEFQEFLGSFKPGLRQSMVMRNHIEDFNIKNEKDVQIIQDKYDLDTGMTFDLKCILLDKEVNKVRNEYFEKINRLKGMQKEMLDLYEKKSNRS